MSTELTQARLKELLHYDPETGVFTWRAGSCNRWPTPGRVAGTPDGKGYLMVAIDGQRYKCHRLAFLYMAGKLPDAQVDHISGAVADNRWDNLRTATQSQNMQNRKVRVDNSSGYPGVNWNSAVRKYIARICVGGVRQYLGCFDDAEEAGKAYLEAKARLHTFQPTQRTL